MFLTAIDQVRFMTSTTIKNICNQLGNLKLKNIPGENVATLGEKASEKVDQIEASGSTLEDLLHLTAKPFTRGTDNTFKTFAINICTKVLNNICGKTCQDLVHEMNTFHNSLLQTDDCAPAKAGKKDKDSILNMLSMLNTKVETLIKKINSNNNSNQNGIQEEDQGHVGIAIPPNTSGKTVKTKTRSKKGTLKGASSSRNTSSTMVGRKLQVGERRLLDQIVLL